jgi:hypothetical protein
MESSFWNDLFEMISIDEINQNQITEKLNSFVNKNLLKQLINKPATYDTGNETMLMWAVWRLKKKTVLDLLEFGANPNFVNEVGESVSTYWNLGIDGTPTDEAQKIACEIAEILHKHCVDLSQSSDMSYGLVKRANKYNLEILKDKLKELGYNL